MKRYKCGTCGAPSCGDNSHVISKYIGPERAVGDRLKCILTQIEDMVERDNLQLYEVRALIFALIEEHFEEEDEE
jgi:hypothetical protein